MDESPGPAVKFFPGDTPGPIVLNDVETRVLGALVEKQLTTPDYYPLTLNALIQACNQLSNREPVVSYDDVTVVRALNRLRELKLAFAFSGAESRTQRYGHKLGERCELGPAELATITVLLLRGPQTVGEIRGRTGRMHAFASLAEVETTLLALATRSPQALAVRLPRQPGAKESRHAHLLSGEIALPAAASSLEQVPAAAPKDDERIAKLEQDVAQLRQELAEIRGQFAQFRKQFE
jgi:hypothetical protein